MSGAAPRTARSGPTVSHVLGEITWLISQSARHQDYRVGDFGWFVMPPLHLRQFHLFRDGDRPVGVAFWAFPSAQVEERLATAPVSPANPLDESGWQGRGHLWLVDLIAPFADASNRHLEVMLGDLMTGPFKGKEFRMLQVDSKTGEGSPLVVGATAGSTLVEQIAQALAGG